MQDKEVNTSNSNANKQTNHISLSRRAFEIFVISSIIYFILLESDIYSYIKDNYRTLYFIIHILISSTIHIIYTQCR